MPQSVKSFVRSLWNENPKYKGLQIMTLGFLVAIVGAGISLLGGFIRDYGEIQSVLNILATVVVYLGGALLVLGAATMLAGIVLHWISIFQGGIDRERK